jgi:hypothetical protein
MTVVIAVLALLVAVLLAVVCGLLVLQLRNLKARADVLADQVAMLEPPPPMAPDLESLLGSGTRRLLVVEILNPLDVALSRNRAAGVLAAMAPERLRKIVIEQASREMVAEMADQGLEVEVRVHAAR